MERIITEFSAKGLKYENTNIQMTAIKKSIEKGTTPADAFATKFHQDKYSSSTTHWRTLMERFDRGGYKAVPLIFSGYLVLV